MVSSLHEVALKNSVKHSDSSGIRSRAHDKAVVPSELDPRVVEAFEGPVPPSETLIWRAMTPTQRKTVLERLSGIRRWDEGNSGVTAEAAAKIAGVSLSRFYRIAAQWNDPDTRSLTVLGAAANESTRRGSRYDPALLARIRAQAERLVREEPAASVRKQVGLIRELFEADSEEMPADHLLRQMVEEAKRAIRHADLSRVVAGRRLALDCCACSIRAEDGGAYILFVLLDRDTRLILGWNLGSIEDSLKGFAGASSYVLAYPEKFGGVHWAERIEDIEIVVGSDREAWEDFASKLSGGYPEAAIRLRTGRRRFGSLLKEVLGQNVGRVALLPAQTARRPLLPVAKSPDEFSHDEALDRLWIEVDAYNADILAKLDSKAVVELSKELLELLATLLVAAD